MWGKEKKLKKIVKPIMISLVVASIAITCVPLNDIFIHAESKENFALDKEGFASFEDVENGFQAKKALDGKEGNDSRWAAKEGESSAWLCVDLAGEKTFDEFRILQENESQRIGKFLIEGSHDGSTFESIYQSEDKSLTNGYEADLRVKLESNVTYRYVRIHIQSLIKEAYPSISLREFEVLGTTAEVNTPVNENLALHKSVTTSVEYATMPGSNLCDDDEKSRWSSEQKPIQWAYVDLQESYNFNTFSMIWEDKNNYASAYNIYVSDDVNKWGDPVIKRTGNTSSTSTEILEDSVKGRYVKLEVITQTGYPSVSCRDFKVMLSDSQISPQDPMENVALNMMAASDSNETKELNALKAVDGDKTTRNSRWASGLGSGQHWLSIDLGEKRNIKTVYLYWETRKAMDYEIQLSDTGAEGSWYTVKHIKNQPLQKNDKIVLDKAETAQYIRLYVNSFTADDPDTANSWNNVSVYEMEVYGGEPSESVSDILNQIKIEEPQLGDKKLKLKLPQNADYEVTYNGTDYEQVVDENLNIYEPIVDTVVNISFKIINKKTKEYEFKEIGLTIPGTYKQEEKDNAAPLILPELREWKGLSGSFTLTSSSRIVYDQSELKEVAEAMAEDYLDLTGNSMEIVQGSPKANDIYFTLTKDASKGLMKEGYLLDINDQVTVSAQTTTGAYWGTRSILQALKKNDFKTLPKGIARDYPLYEIRGFILDVGRKTFTMDYLQQLVKEMSWYKMNDFQIHLNDNLIPLEYYSQKGEDVFQAYSAFRLESTIKEGGNNGLNKQDLTSTDMFYSKNEFRDLIKESRTLGVNIVPEIDTPAHSLVLTKVRPDLRLGEYGRENDHLNLISKYSESLSFVQSIFSEYMTEENPVFDEETIVHIGADEYHASSESYRRFVNDMLDYVEDTGRKARVWGSFTQANKGEEIEAEGVEINLWNFGYANMDQMYENGFDLINCNDGNYYIVPNAGYYYDYLSDSTMYNLDINTIGGVTIPAGDDQMKGGAFAVWNDMTDYLDNGVSEYDVYDRIERGLPLFAAKLWGKGSMNLQQAKQTSDDLGDAPRTNFGYEITSEEDAILNLSMDNLKDSSSNHHAITLGKNAEIEQVDFKNALKLNGKESYIKTDLDTAGLGNDLRIKVKRTSNSLDEQILLESSYGSMKAVQKDTGKVGFSRELFDYSFNYTLPINEWVELEFKNQQNKMELYVNGKLVDVLGDDEKIEGRKMLATGMFPLSRIGSMTNAFIGYVDDVRIGKNDSFVTTMQLDHAIWNAEAVLSTQGNVSLSTTIKEAKKLLSSYQPDQAKISQYTKDIEDALTMMKYQKADYTRIDAYISLTKTLDQFTKGSVQQLNQALDNVRYKLPYKLQTTVDSYESAIVSALDRLTLTKEIDQNFIDQSKLSASASSYQKDGSDPKNVLDGSTSTMWHTAWSNTTMPHWINLENKESMEVKGVVYVPRQTGVNGNLTKYRIEVSDNGSDYQTVAEGTLKNDTETKTISFDPVKTKHVRIVYVGAVNNNGSASEIQLIQANVKADINGLNEMINHAKALKDYGFTQQTWNALQNVITKAESLLESEDANAVIEMKQELAYSIVSLRLTAKVEAVDKSVLEMIIKEAESKNKEMYTEESWIVFETTLKEAHVVFLDDKAVQEEVDKAATELTNSIQALVENIVEDVVQKDKLYEALEKYAGYISTDYTKETWNLFKQAYDHASTVYTNLNATQEMVDQAMEKLIETASNLKKEEAETIDPSTPEKEESNKTDTENETTKKPDKVIPETGTQSYIGIWFISIILTGIVIRVWYHKRKSM